MENYKDILKCLDVFIEDLSPEQLESLKRISNRINDPNSMTVNQAMNIVNELGLDIEKLQKNARKIRAESYVKNKKPKIKVNEKCPCESGKKYKKCCMSKN
jgi:preprotein translocase subunit SecA